MTPLRALALLLMLAACNEDSTAEAPPAIEMTEESLSFFCQMGVLDHGGPKGQVHLEGYEFPLFFAQVRDLVAYLKSPERDARIMAIYVSDMDKMPVWDRLEPGNWIRAEAAHFVVGAPVAGGMGAQEVVPFGTMEGAQVFRGIYGGAVMSLEEIPDDAVLGPVDFSKDLETPS